MRSCNHHGILSNWILFKFFSFYFFNLHFFFIFSIFQPKRHTKKLTTFISIISFSGLALYFKQSFILYLILRALLGIASVSVTYAGLILAIEYVDGIWRTIAGMYNLFPLPLSYIMISGIAYLTQDYNNLQLCIGLPGVFLCLLWWE